VVNILYFYTFYIICFLIYLEDKAMRNWICASFFAQCIKPFLYNLQHGLR
jgi:hypothetical protein